MTESALPGENPFAFSFYVHLVLIPTALKVIRLVK